LAWLSRAVAEASPEQLRGLDGEADGSGGWRGRRQVVWLCEALAGFPESFWESEAILFRLALFETEQRIANSSTGVWTNLFLPMLSHTAVPFTARLDHLLGRLARATSDEQPLVMAAAIGLLRSDFGRVEGPRVVGGRLVPEEWRPRTYGELWAMQAESARRVLETVSALPRERQPAVLKAIVNQIASFLDHGALEQLRDLLNHGELDDETLRSLRLRLDDYVSRRQEAAEQGRRDADALAEVQRWRSELEPQDLLTRIRDVTGRDYWTYERPGSRGSARLVYDTYVREKCRLLTRALSEREVQHGVLPEQVLPVLTDLAGRAPEAVMEAVGRHLLDEERRGWYILHPLRGLFEAIGLDVVQPWVRAGGGSRAKRIAPHIESPEPTDQDPDAVPPLTEWLLTEFEADDDVFRAFLLGRHPMETYWGPARDHYRGLNERMAPYLTHPLHRIREWAQRELQSAEGMISWDDRREAERDRE
jgi:hypothetical protein